VERGNGWNQCHQTRLIITDLITQFVDNMKKITMSVAALTIAISSYSQCVMSYNDYSDVDTICHAKIVTMTAEDMIGQITEDVANGHIYKEYADLYIENLLKIISRIEDLTQNK